MCFVSQNCKSIKNCLSWGNMIFIYDISVKLIQYRLIHASQEVSLNLFKTCLKETLSFMKNCPNVFELWTMFILTNHLKRSFCVLDYTKTLLHNLTLLQFIESFSEILCHGPGAVMLRDFPAFSRCLKYKERERQSPTLRPSPAGPDLTIDNTTLTVGHRVKNSDPQDNHHGGQGLSSQDGEHQNVIPIKL